MDYREWDQVPDLDLVQSPERRDLDYTDIQGGNRIGLGGHADVSRVTVGGTTLVVKEPRLQGTVSKNTYEAFLDEAETWAALDNHENVVGVIDWDAERVPWIAMEDMDGESLRKRVDNGGIETREALWISVCLSRAIQHAHRHGVAHLDLKPANVLFRKTPDGLWDVPKVADWGLSSYLIKHSGTVEGLTPNYAAPEQFDADKYGSPDDFTDRYQLAALLYEALTGQQVVSGSGAKVLQEVLNEPITPPTEIHPELPNALDPIFEQALAKEKADRYETVVNFRRDLETVLENFVQEMRPHTEDIAEQGTVKPEDLRTSGTSNNRTQSDTEISDPAAETSSNENGSPTYLPPLEPSHYISTQDTDPLLKRVPEIIIDNDDNLEYRKHILKLTGKIPVPRDSAMPLRIPIQTVHSNEDGVLCRGNVVTGEIQNGTGVEFEPSNVVGEVDGVNINSLEDGSTISYDNSLNGEPGDVVEFGIDPIFGSKIDEIHPGDVCGRSSNPSEVVNRIHARLIILDHDTVVSSGYTPSLHVHTIQTTCEITALETRYDPETDEILEEDPEFVELGDGVEAVIKPQTPISVEPVIEFPELGIFALRDVGKVVAVGVVTDIENSANSNISDVDTTEEEDDITIDPLERLPKFDFEDFDINNNKLTALFERVADGSSIPSRANASTRLPIDDVYTLSGVGTVPTGFVETGSLNNGDTVSFQPSDVSGEVTKIEMNHEEVSTANSGDSVRFSVQGIEKEDIRRGDVCGPADEPPTVAETFQAQIFVIQHPSVVTAGYSPVFHAHTAQAACTIESIEEKIDPSTGEITEENPDFINAGDVGVVIVRPQKPLSVEPFEEVPELGTFAVRDMGQTIAAGAVVDIEER